MKIMVVAGTRDLCRDLQQGARALLSSARVRSLFPHFRFDTVGAEIKLPHGGQISWSWIGKSRIGRGADIVVIDDSLPPGLAENFHARQRVNEIFDAEIAQRLDRNTNGRVIVTMQRLHPEDLTGHLLAGSEPWTHIVIPAIALQDETWSLADGKLFLRRKGEALCPALQTRDQLRAKLLEVGARIFSAQYLQNPDVRNDYRTGAFFEHVCENWTPEMDWPQAMVGEIPESDFMLHSVFGEKEVPWHAHSNLTTENWEKATYIQQRRLIESSGL